MRLGIDSYSHSFCSPVSTTHVQQRYSKYRIVFFPLLSQALLIADVCGFLVRFSSKIHGSLQCLQCQCVCHYSPQTTKQTNDDLRNNESQTTVFLSYSSLSSPFSFSSDDNTFNPMSSSSVPPPFPLSCCVPYVIRDMVFCRLSKHFRNSIVREARRT